MSHHVLESLKSNKIVLIIIFGIVITTLLLLAHSFTQVAAQEDRLTMSDFLRRATAEERSILFQFAVPLIAQENVWIVPDGLDGAGDEFSIHISEIGHDYICFRNRAGGAIDMRCTPFSNIVQISYLDM